jgi:1,4-dihydroxy-2-naphthoyl-CoA hydrolase
VTTADEFLARFRSPFDERVGIQLQEVGPDRVTAVVDLEPDLHHHPWAGVHGGLYCTLVETLSTVGAALASVPSGKAPAGIENHTSFVRTVSSGRVLAEALPLQRGSRLHLWEVRIRDEEGRLLARGTCRLALLDPR